MFVSTIRTVMSQDKTAKLNLKCNIIFNILSVQIHTLPTSILMIVLCELCECRCNAMELLNSTASCFGAQGVTDHCVSVLDIVTAVCQHKVM